MQEVAARQARRTAVSALPERGSLATSLSTTARLSAPGLVATSRHGHGISVLRNVQRHVSASSADTVDRSASHESAAVVGRFERHVDMGAILEEEGHLGQRLTESHMLDDRPRGSGRQGSSPASERTIAPVPRRLRVSKNDQAAPWIPRGSCLPGRKRSTSRT